MIYLARFSARLLRRHVPDSSTDDAGCRLQRRLELGSNFVTSYGLLLRLDQFRQTKIQNLRMAIARDHDVVGFEIAMNNAAGVGFRQTLRGVLQISQQLSEFG